MPGRGSAQHCSASAQWRFLAHCPGSALPQTSSVPLGLKTCSVPTASLIFAPFFFQYATQQWENSKRNHGHHHRSISFLVFFTRFPITIETSHSYGSSLHYFQFAWTFTKHVGCMRPLQLPLTPLHLPTGSMYSQSSLSSHSMQLHRQLLPLGRGHRAHCKLTARNTLVVLVLYYIIQINFHRLKL